MLLAESVKYLSELAGARGFEALTSVSRPLCTTANLGTTLSLIKYYAHLSFHEYEDDPFGD
jgi:hypothetical protein